MAEHQETVTEEELESRVAFLPLWCRACESSKAALMRIMLPAGVGKVPGERDTSGYRSRDCTHRMGRSQIESFCRNRNVAGLLKL